MGGVFGGIGGSLGSEGSFSAWKRRVIGSLREASWLERAQDSMYACEVDVVAVRRGRWVDVVVDEDGGGSRVVEVSEEGLGAGRDGFIVIVLSMCSAATDGLVGLSSPAVVRFFCEI